MRWNTGKSSQSQVPLREVNWDSGGAVEASGGQVEVAYLLNHTSSSFVLL